MGFFCLCLPRNCRLRNQRAEQACPKEHDSGIIQPFHDPQLSDIPDFVKGWAPGSEQFGSIAGRCISTQFIITDGFNYARPRKSGQGQFIFALKSGRHICCTELGQSTIFGITRMQLILFLEGRFSDIDS